MTWIRGQSGNAAGRPPSTNAHNELKQAIADSMPDIILALIERAKEGDVPAAVALMSKVIPNIKPVAPTAVIPIGESLADQGQRVLYETLRGNISSDTAAQLMASLAAQSKIIEINELEVRLTLLEQQR